MHQCVLQQNTQTTDPTSTVDSANTDNSATATGTNNDADAPDGSASVPSGAGIVLDGNVPESPPGGGDAESPSDDEGPVTSDGTPDASVPGIGEPAGMLAAACITLLCVITCKPALLFSFTAPEYRGAVNQIV